MFLELSLKEHFDGQKLQEILEIVTFFKFSQCNV